jgi:plasmid stabilization system protein ParE
MAEYQLSPLAVSDIKDISAATIEAWGKKQVRFYLEKLHNTLLMLASNPDLGLQRDEIFSGAKSFYPANILFSIALSLAVLKWLECYTNVWICITSLVTKRFKSTSTTN